MYGRFSLRDRFASAVRCSVSLPGQEDPAGRFASAVKRSTSLSKQENPAGAFWVYGRFGCAAILRVRLHVRPVEEKRPRPPSVLGQAKCAPRLWNVELWHKRMWKGKGKEEWERSR